MALASDAGRLAPQDLSLLPMEARHVDAVHAIERVSQRHPWSRRMFADCLEVGYSAWVVTGPEGGVRGFSLHSMALDEAHLLNLAVAPLARRRGIGRRLLDHVMEQARAAQVDKLLLEVRASNTAAIALYSAMDFALLAPRRGYYPDGEEREDALVLQRLL